MMSTSYAWRFAVLLAACALSMEGVHGQDYSTRPSLLEPSNQAASLASDRWPSHSGTLAFPDLESTDDANLIPEVERHRPAAGFQGIFGNRRGIDGNDYSVFLFLPWDIDPGRQIVFAAFRGGVTDGLDLVGSLGIGHRLFVESIDSLLGASVWFDMDQSRQLTYHRAGGQIEFLAQSFEVRGGVDFVLQANKPTLVDPDYKNAAPFFFNNNIALGFFHAETPYDQFYVEVGGPLPWLGQFGLNAYVGTNLLWSDSEHTLGWQTRLAAELTRDVQIGTQFTYDDVFDSSASFTIALTIPSGGVGQLIRSLGSILERAEERPFPVVSRINNHVVREHRIPIHVTATNTPMLALNTQTNQPLVVVHVNPNASASGDGSFENPFGSLEAARLANNSNVQIIRVVPRGDNSGTNLAVTAPFGLLANQRLLSSAVQHQFESTRGTFSLPGFTGGNLPILTNSMATPSAVVRIVNDSEVSGFTIDGSGLHVGLQGNIHNFDINRNTIQNATNGVQLANAQGEGIIVHNTFRDNLNDGVHISATNGNSLNLNVTGNTASGNGDDAVDITTTGTRLDVTFADNQFGGNGDDGIALTSTGESLVIVNLLGNRLGEFASAVAGNGNAGFRFIADSGFASLTIGGSSTGDGNTILGNGGEGLSFDLSNSALAIATSQNNVMPTPATSANTFDIVMEFGSGFTSSQRSSFASAAAHWQSIIIGDLPRIGSIDDVRITAIIEDIDGVGGTLAEASPSGLRSGSHLPFLGTISMDSADLFSLESNGRLEDVIRHEVAHVLGFGTIWSQSGLISGAGGSDPRFLGSHATAEYNSRFGVAEIGVPLENEGDVGTIDSHWRESIFTNELMTGTINGAVRPISRITIGHFIDLGYEANLSQADPY